MSYNNDKNEKISVNITGEMTVGEFAEQIRNVIYSGADTDVDPAWFIALLEYKLQDGDTLILLANHFNYHVEELKKDLPDWRKYTPKIGVPKSLLELKSESE